jgi:SAM-dependent methyltransferase
VRRAWEPGLPLTLVRGDARRLPFADGSFDLVFHQGLLEHFRDPAPVVAEHARMLAPGGVLLIDVPQRWHAYTAVKRLLIALDRWFAGWERSFSVRELEGLMAAAGLEILVSYASWPEPGLAYRALRLALGRLGLRLPGHPRPLPLLGPAGARLRAALRYRRLGHYTGMVLGTVARRPGAPAP